MDQIFDRLGNLLKSILQDDQPSGTRRSEGRFSDEDLKDAWEELDEFLNEDGPAEATPCRGRLWTSRRHLSAVTAVLGDVLGHGLHVIDLRVEGHLVGAAQDVSAAAPGGEEVFETRPHVVFSFPEVKAGFGSIATRTFSTNSRGFAFSGGDERANHARPTFFLKLDCIFGFIVAKNYGNRRIAEFEFFVEF